ncbi:MAG: hypothetical protein AB7S36_19915, partial [Planctomycetota bacterium]
CAFAVWIFWSVIVVMIQRLHDTNPTLFAFPDANGNAPTGDAYRAMLYTLPAIAGLAGATLRIPNSFMIALAGGRTVITLTTALLILPALGVGLALRDPNTSFNLLVAMAVLSGVGGGAFASSMSNISFFFPKRVQGTSLGLNAGLGNVGVSVMQVLIPLAVTVGIFGGAGYQVALQGGGMATTFPENAGLVWAPILAFLAIAAWLGMTNLPAHRAHSTAVGFARVAWLELLGFIAAGVGAALMLLDWGGVPQMVQMLAILLVTVVLTLVLMRWVTPKGTRDRLVTQFAIFRNKHNWIMTWLYVMTFGSFIGFSAAFPKLIVDVFGYIRVDAAGNPLAEVIRNPHGPNALAFAWLGPLVGSLIRPVGGWLSDKFGGARVTHWDTLLMIGATIGVAYFVVAARNSATPEDHFVPFLILFLILFVTTGIGNGSTFRMIPIIFKPEQAGPVLGWTSAVAAYGAFLVPGIFGMQIKAGFPEYAFYGFAVYYVSCLALNWWFYARRGAATPC